MHFDEHTCSSSHTFILRAVGCSTTSLRAWQLVPRVLAVVCLLDKTLAVISEVAVAGIAAVVGSDRAEGWQGSGLKPRGWGVCSRAAC